MTRRMNRERAIAAALKDILGTPNNGWYSIRNIRTELEVELLPALEKFGFTIIDIDTAWRGAEGRLNEVVE